jgi:hypothetical protein
LCVVALIAEALLFATLGAMANSYFLLQNNLIDSSKIDINQLPIPVRSGGVLLVIVGVSIIALVLLVVVILRSLYSSEKI